MNKKHVCAGSYLLVLQMWAKSAFHHLCSDIANAETPAAKTLAFEQLKNDAPKYSAIIQGVSMLYVDEETTTLSGQVGVAKDLFQSILNCGFSDVHRVAIVAWLQDVEESKQTRSCEQKEKCDDGDDFKDGSSDGCCSAGCQCGRDADEDRSCGHLD